MTIYTWTDDTMRKGSICDFDKVADNLMHLKYNNATMTPTLDTSNMPTMSNTNLTGTISTSVNSPTVTGVGTIFTTEASAGTIIEIGGAYYTVSSVTSDTLLTLSHAVPTAYSSINSSYNNKITFSSGFCWDDTLCCIIKSSASVKNLSLAFVENIGNGGLDIGAISSSTWYHCFVIAKNDGTSDFLFSTSLSLPTMPADYTYKRRIGSIKTDINGNIVSFKQNADYFWYKTQILDLSLTMVGTLPPTDLITSVAPNTTGMFSVFLENSNANLPALYFTVYDKTNGAISRNVAVVFGPYGQTLNDFLLNVDNVSKIRYGTTYIEAATIIANSTGILSLRTNGYIDKRGVH